ncbi:F-ATPase gamma subunit [Salinivirga cyanobacteriivorans]|uniref:ATP synthase gamma chain n=1 Tax=Salinivirga cyanobacteriivorans TaxID=1307839 RepID=A0A0S2I0B7_9BACT|nr:ATP synthase F1 subunit gamma [Salinivirga cyanobacteriivorans]ALO15650.1 F-ATPase gamma subunit [Salinivirga cyanobacteriivorans]
MANLKEIRTRIASVKNTRQVTSAMKMVAAAKLRKAQDAIFKIRPYTDALHKVAEQIAAAGEEDITSPLTEHRETNNMLVVLFTSNKGLCGAFNYQVTKAAINHVKNEYHDLLEEDRIQFLTIGKKGDEIVKREGFQVWKNMDDLLDHSQFKESATVANEIVDVFLNKEFDKVALFYNGFKNAAVQRVTHETFLPVEIGGDEEGADPNYILEPTAGEIVMDLMPKILQISFHSALLDSVASEHGARMTAMHKATENATDLIKDLTLNYNKARQAAITNEITEIVSGANALGK